jgi:predicted acetyltransferase
MSDFIFMDPGELIDGDLQLILIKTHPAEEAIGHVPSYDLEMRWTGTTRKIGHISVRIGDLEQIQKYAGHIGYGVDAGHRGHRYAARSCLLLLPFAKEHRMNTLWITCDTDNIASRRTCEIAGGELVEIVNVPEGNAVFIRGALNKKCRYRFDL